MSEEVPNTPTADVVKSENNERLISSLPDLETTVLNKFPFKVGRSTHCDLIIDDHQMPVITALSISKNHFVFTKNLENNETYLTDLSKNGTYINGKRIKKDIAILLKDGTKIGFGLSTSNAFVYQKPLKDELQLTLTPLTVSDSVETIQINNPWGRLITCMMYLDSIDVIQLTFKVGKTSECDLKIDETELREGIKNVFSREHFSIEKDPDHPIAYIRDHSKFGTYLNGVLIGKNNTHILQNDDIIAIGRQKYEIFIYRRLYSLGLNNLPSDFHSQYETVKPIGKGAAGEVLLAFEKTTCEMVAIKKIFKAKSTISQKHKLNHPSKIRSEINILKNISHPFIIHMKNYVETPDEVFLVLEYMKGGELTKRILSNNPLTEANIKVLFYQIVKAIEFLHYNGIIHRDLKPANVLLASEDAETLVKVSDFGLSKINDDDDTMKTFCGTLHYMAPELFDGKYKKQADIWSLGVILYYMLAKKLPFGYNKKELYYRIKHGEYSMDSEWDIISEEAIDLVQQILRVNPEERITIEDILKHPWLANDTRMQNKIQFILLNNIVNPVDIITPLDADRPQKRLRLEESEEEYTL